MNPPRFQRLNYNPSYYTPDEKDLKIGDDIVIGIYASDFNGNPNIKWIETTVGGLPLCEFYYQYVTCRRLIPIKVIRKQKLEKLNGTKM